MTKEIKTETQQNDGARVAAQIPKTVEETLCQFNIPLEQIPTDQVPRDAWDKMSDHRDYWDFRLDWVYFMNTDGNVYRAKLPPQNVQSFLEVYVKIPGHYVASRLLNRLPLECLTNEQQERRNARNQARGCMYR